MPRKCSVAYCKGNYASTGQAVKIFSFPKGSDELKDWLDRLPNKIEPNHVTCNMGVCSSHWPDSTEMRRHQGGPRPANPPSIFNCPSSHLRQTLTVPRNINKRNISLTDRNAEKDQMDQFNKEDLILSWANFCEHLESKDYILLNQVHLKRTEEQVIIFTMNIKCNNRDLKIVISDTFLIEAYKFGSKLCVRNLLGFQPTLKRWSQLQNISIRILETPQHHEKMMKLDFYVAGWTKFVTLRG